MQGGPYQALSFLPDKGAILYALHQRVGETLILNGIEDNLVAVPHHGASFFDDLNSRVAALSPGVPKIEYRFYAGVGHRPSWVNLDAADLAKLKASFSRVAEDIARVTWRIPHIGMGRSHGSTHQSGLPD